MQKEARDEWYNKLLLSCDQRTLLGKTAVYSAFSVCFCVVFTFIYIYLYVFYPITLASDDEFENFRIKGPNAVQLVKTTPLKLSPLPQIPETIKEVIYDMLNALAAYHAPEEGNISQIFPQVSFCYACD